MKKKLLAVLSLMTLFTASVFAAGCGQTSGSSDTGASNTDSSSQLPDVSDSTGSEETPAEPSIQLNVATLSVEIYESATLTATLENSEESIVWVSSDETVAKVVDGVVTAYKEGTATITATAGEVSASCQITVTAATETPIFAELPESLTIIKSLTEELDATLTYKGNTFTMATVTFATEGGVLSVDENGVVTAVDYGTQNVVVKAFVGEEEIASKTIAVEVIEYGQLIVEIPENTLNLTVGDEGFALSAIQVQLNGGIVENPTLVAVSEDDSIAAVQDGKIIAVETGETTVTVSYVSESGKTYETTITVIATKIVEKTGVNFFVRGSSEDLASANTGTAEIEIPASIDLSTLTQVLCGEQEVAFSKDGNKLTFTNAPAGEQTYTLVTAVKDYVIEGCIYNNTISTKEEFLSWREAAGDIYAYTVLTADIDLEGAVLETASYLWLRSWLDGRSHTISNFTLKTSLVPNVHATGGFRNLQFVNVVQDCTGVTQQMKFGFITQIMYGTVENVFIMGRLQGIGDDVAHWGTVCYGFNADSVVQNVVVHLSSTSTAIHYVVGPNGGGGVVNNIHFIFDGPSAKVSAGAPENSAIYANDEALAKADFSLFSDEWTAVAGEIPYMSDYSAALENAAVTVSGEANLGQTLTFNTTSFYPLTYALGEEYTDISIEVNQVTVGEGATIDSQFNVVVTCEAVATFEKNFTFTVEKPIKNTGLTLLAKGDAALTEQNANTGNATVDLTDTEIDVSKVTEIRVGGVALDSATYSISDGKISFVNAPAGENVYTFVSTTVEYTMNICIYNYEIATKADFSAWRNTNVWKYAVLTQDIDLENEVLGAAGASAMRGILDGRGHKISNFTVSTGIVTSMQAAGGFKNISFINVTQDCTGIETASVKAIRYGFLTQTMHGTVENVYIQGKIVNVAEGISHWGMLVYNSGATAVIKNVVLDIVSDCAGANFVINTTTFKEIDNVHLNFRTTNETIGKVVITDAAATNSAVYLKDEDVAKADFALFTGIWKVEEGKLPYMD